MEMTFEWPEWPTALGDQLSFVCAGITVFFGVLLLFLPGISLRILRLQPHPDHPEAVGEARSTMAGFYLGVGLSAILFAQPFIYMALGFSWLFTAFGRFVSILSDRGGTVYNWISLLIELALGLIPLAAFFQLFPAS
jgi:hypothetical protein